MRAPSSASSRATRARWPASMTLSAATRPNPIRPKACTSSRTGCRCRGRADPGKRSLTMRITQGTFSYLPELTDEEITSQLGYALGQGWAVSVEFNGDPHPRNNYWDMWGLPMFDLP